METINDRIAAVIELSGLTKTAFAEKINLSQSYISQICIGNKTPSDRTISDICREFGVNETWLRSGSGLKYSLTSISDEVAAFAATIIHDPDAVFKRRFIAALASLYESEWMILEHLTAKLAQNDEQKKEQE